MGCKCKEVQQTAEDQLCPEEMNIVEKARSDLKSFQLAYSELNKKFIEASHAANYYKQDIEQRVIGFDAERESLNRLLGLARTFINEASPYIPEEKQKEILSKYKSLFLTIRK